MKVVSYRAWDVCVPVQSRRVSSPGLGEIDFDRLPITLVEFTTDVGLVGLGETRQGTRREDLLEAIRWLKGREVTRIPLQEPSHSPDTPSASSTEKHEDKSITSNRPASHAIHLALFDLLGKHAGLPASTFLGGAVRDHIRVDAWQSRMTPTDSANAAKAAMDEGASGLKFHCTLDDDVPRRAAAIRDACGSNFKITVDPNSRLRTYRDSIHLLRELAVVGNVACVVDPFPKDRLKDWKRLHDDALFPIAAHDGYTKTLAKILRKRICDRANLTAHPFEILHATALCRAAKIPCWISGEGALGVGEAMILHAAAACPAISLPCDLFGRSLREHNLITATLNPSQGQIAVPTAPGLGVELDHNAIEKFCTSKFEGHLHP